MQKQVLIFFLFGILCLSVVSAQTCSISGIVKNKCNQPMQNVNVTLTLPDGTNYSVMTNESGYFKFENLPEDVLTSGSSEFYFERGCVNETEEVGLECGRWDFAIGPENCDQDNDGVNSSIDPDDCNASIPEAPSPVGVSKKIGCRVTQDECSNNEVLVLKMSDAVNAHAELPSQDNYAYNLCCNRSDYIDVNNYTDTECRRDDEAPLLTLSSETNAHVAKPGYYGHIICLRSINKELPITCEINETLKPGFSCVASISSLENAHIAECGYYPYYVQCMVGNICDWDGDGYLAMTMACGGNDCDDTNSFINPGQSSPYCNCTLEPVAEVGDYYCNDGLDNDCDGDVDGDDRDCLGYGECEKIKDPPECRSYGSCFWSEADGKCKYCSGAASCSKYSETDCKEDGAPCGLSCEWDEANNICTAKACKNGYTDEDQDTICFGGFDNQGNPIGDNCPYIYNPDQLDCDNDRIGDACDPDCTGDNCPSGACPSCTATDEYGMCVEFEDKLDRSCQDANGIICQADQDCIGGDFITTNDTNYCCFPGRCGYFHLTFAGVSYLTEASDCKDPDGDGIGERRVVITDASNNILNVTIEKCVAPSKKGSEVGFFGILSLIISALILGIVYFKTRRDF